MRRFLAVLLTLVAILAAGWLALRRPDIPFNTLENAYANAQSQFLAASEGRRVHFRDEGNVDGPALVLVHGFSASLHTWEPWVDALEDEYRIVSLDLPGHGLTRGFALDEMDMDGFGEVIDAVVDTVGLDSFTLVGSSMGGHAAWTYALEQGQRLDALVLVGAAGWPADGDQDTPLILRLMENPLARGVISDLDMSALIRSGLEDSFVNTDLVTDEMVQRYVSLSRAPGHRTALLHILANHEGRSPATAGKMAEIEVPTLVMHGRQDNLVPAEGGEAFARTIPGAALIIYEDVGHLPQEEIPHRSAADLDAFLESVHEPAREIASDSTAAGSN